MIVFMIFEVLLKLLKFEFKVQTKQKSMWKGMHLTRMTMFWRTSVWIGKNWTKMRSEWFLTSFANRSNWRLSKKVYRVFFSYFLQNSQNRPRTIVLTTTQSSTSPMILVGFLGHLLVFIDYILRIKF